MLDLLKGIAIIAVVFYHLGLFKYGYLGVEVFFVISGFLTTKSILNSYDQNADFGYFAFIFKRFVRLFPLVLILCTISFAVAYFIQLPDNFKNTCETTIGTLTFTNNYVQYITSGNYWDTSNDFKPLMHTWYLGVLMQFYLLYPLAVKLLCKVRIGMDKSLSLTILVGGAMSFVLYLLGNNSDAAKFFLFPCRYWEFALGSYVAIAGNGAPKAPKICVCTALTCVLLCFNIDVPSNAYRLIFTTIVTAVIISSLCLENSCRYLRIPAISLLGKASFSIYVWHQFVFAYYRYVFNANFDIVSCCLVLVVSLVISLISYFVFEQKFTQWMTAKKVRVLSVVGLDSMIAVALIGICLLFYKHNGIVRDIPELGINKKDTSFQCQDYNSRNNAFDTDFQSNGKRNILVLGDSFARDWINVLRESGALQSYNVSVHSHDDSLALSRAKQADIIFIANNGSFNFNRAMPEIANHQYFRIGHKGFGKCNGNVYSRLLFGVAGYDQTFQYDDSLNEEERKMFGNHFIDVMATIKLPNGRYPYFTPSHRFFSHDGIHLTQAGAKRFAKLLDIKRFLLDNADR